MTSSMLFSCMTCSSHPKSVLSDIPEEILDELSKTKISNIYKKGQTLFYEGNRPYGVYCMNSGKVKLTIHSCEGKDFIVKIAQAGDLIGYRSFFTDELYTLTAEIIEDASICFIDRERFFDLLKKHPPFSLKLLSMMGHDIKCAEENSSNLAFKSAQERIVELLFTFKESYGINQDNGNIKLDILISRDELASMIGTTTETAVRLTTWLKDKDLIEMSKKYMYITDLVGLQALIPSY
ncbi:MAG: Crp/Fnr family transcriptional regulator [Candidatus Sericytochromatia bacterium]|nr:Crp/Fnr family transcriptional regulator [Candidatus Sericytochromatia bacterium]